MDMIWAEGLTKYYDNFLAVEDVNLQVPKGQVLVLLGPNGAGKTTTIRMLTSILRPTRGQAKVAGFDVVTQGEKVRASVGVLTEQHSLYGRMNADEYFMFFGSLYGLDQETIRRRTAKYLEKFGLSDVARRRLGELSKGMRQKMSLVRTLLHDPPVLLLDEPTSAMDPESAHTVRESLILLRSAEHTIVLCTHNLPEADALADQIAIISSGRIILYDTLQGMKRKLLGPDEFELVFRDPLGDWVPEFPPGITLVSRGQLHFRFLVDHPKMANPIILDRCVKAGYGVVSFSEVPHSLEQAYLQAIAKLQPVKPL